MHKKRDLILEKLVGHLKIEEEICLKDKLEMRRILISRNLLIRAGLRLSVDSDRLVITHNGEFVGKCIL